MWSPAHAYQDTPFGMDQLEQAKLAEMRAVLSKKRHQKEALSKSIDQITEGIAWLEQTLRAADPRMNDQ